MSQRNRCPHCGQVMLVRYGVRLQPKQVEIFDVLESVESVSRTRLAEIFYPDHSRLTAVKTVSVHINHINDRLEATDLKISGGRDGYRLVGRTP